MDQLKRAYWYLVVLTIGLFLWTNAIAVVGWISNSNRVNEIQASRLESCEKNYEAFRKVFKPFFRPAAQQTPKERSDQAKLNRTVDKLKKQCKQQIKPK